MSYAVGPNLTGSYAMLAIAVLKIAVRDARNGDTGAWFWLFTTGSIWVDTLGESSQMVERFLQRLMSENVH